MVHKLYRKLMNFSEAHWKETCPASSAQHYKKQNLLNCVNQHSIYNTFPFYFRLQIPHWLYRKIQQKNRLFKTFTNMMSYKKTIIFYQLPWDSVENCTYRFSCFYMVHKQLPGNFPCSLHGELTSPTVGMHCKSLLIT